MSDVSREIHYQPPETITDAEALVEAEADLAATLAGGPIPPWMTRDEAINDVQARIERLRTQMEG